MAQGSAAERRARSASAISAKGAVQSSSHTIKAGTLLDDMQGHEECGGGKSRKLLGWPDRILAGTILCRSVVGGLRKGA